MSKEEGQEEKKDWPVCVFYPDDIKCPVRFAIVSSSSVKNIMKPATPKFDDRTTGIEIGKSMMEGVMKAVGMEWSVLASFCHICPLKFREDQKLMQIPSIHPMIPASALQECPKCHAKSIFPFCPKCGTKLKGE